MTANPARCGRIAYTNDLPVYAGFDEAAVPLPGIMVSDVPTALNDALLAGRLDCSPISSAFYAEHADAFVLMPRICIGSRRDVRSICCIANGPLDSIRDQVVAITRESATGRALLVTICQQWHGFTPRMLDVANPLDEYVQHGTPCLLIGDAAIEASFSVPAP